MTGPDIERFAAADMTQLLTVTESAGWRHTANDWQAALDAGTVSGHRADGGEIVSTIALFPYGGVLCSIGMVVVKPERRGHGLAKALMLHALASPPSATCPTILIATPFGLPLYQRLGFTTIDRVRSMIRSEGARHGVPPSGRMKPSPARSDDLTAICRLDAAATGLDRSRVLEARLRYARRASVLRADEGDVVGFGIATPMRDAVMIGPVVAPDADSAMALIAHLVAGHDGRVRADLPIRQAELATMLIAAGFSSGDEAPVMIYRGDGLPGDRTRLFAIANRAFC